MNICYFKILKISNSVWMSMLLNGAKQLRLCANLYRCASYGSKNIIEIRLDLYLLCGCFSLFPVIHCLFNLFQHIKCCWSNVYIASSKLWVVFKPSCVHFALIEFFVYHNHKQYGREMKKNCNMLYYNLHQTNHNQIRPRIWMYGNIGISFDWPAFCNSFVERFMFQSIFYGNI